MEKFYFTFGIGKSLLANRYVVIEAESYEAAREIMIESFGTKWAFQYTEKEWNYYFTGKVSAEENIAEKYGLQKLNVNEFWR